MFGRATLTIVTSMISSSVAVTMAIVMSARRQPYSTTFRSSGVSEAVPGHDPFRGAAAAGFKVGLLDLDGRLDRHPGAQRIVWIRIVEDDADRNALRDLDEVPRRVLRGHETKGVLRRGPEIFDVAHELHALVGIDVDVDFLTLVHVADLRLFVIGGDVDVVRGDKSQQHLARGNGLPDLDVLLAHVAVDRRVDTRVAEVVARGE